ncbi:unnamed protein product, partial [Prorocentrum cordatum]
DLLDVQTVATFFSLHADTAEAVKLAAAGHKTDLEYLLLKSFSSYHQLDSPSAEQKKQLRLDISREMASRVHAGTVLVDNLADVLAVAVRSAKQGRYSKNEQQ